MADDVVILQAEPLRRLVAAIFVAAGASGDDAQLIAESLVETNLVGHDSHGVIRVPAYVNAIKSGRLNPRGEIAVVRETPAAARLDCGWCFGQVAARRGMQLAIEKARAVGVGMVILSHCQHIGRLGEYAVMAAERGMVGQVWANGSSPGGIVAPFGGVGRALGSNPIAWAVPGGRGPEGARPPIFFDYATAIVAQGKFQVAADKNEEIPEGWLLDKEGRPTRNPRDQMAGGTIMPFGAYKGYALGLMIELTGGGLGGGGFPLLPGHKWDQGTVMIATDIATFQPLDEFEERVARYTALLKETPRAPGVEEILLPGDLEWRSKERRERDGIPLPRATWERIKETAAGLGVGADGVV